MRASSGHTIRKRYGQHFLHDQAVVARIVAAMALRDDDRVVEIGPGTGALTGALLAALPRLLAVEIDRDLASDLARRFTSRGLELHVGDALRFDFAAHAARARDLRIVGNLPYNVSTPLLFHLLGAHEAIRDMHFMLQREVVARLAAEPGGKVYGRLSVMMQAHCRVEPLFRVGPGAFRPPPKVESAVVRLTPHADLPLPRDHLPALGNVVSAAFSQRRKTLRNSLRGLLAPSAIAQAGIDPAARAETLSLGDYAHLAAIVAARSPPGEGC